MADGMPIISQLKSLVLAISGDTQKAKETQLNFTKRCPIISQLRSLGEAITGDEEAAKETQKEFLGNVGYMVAPIVGGVAGLVVGGPAGAILVGTAAAHAANSILLNELLETQDKVQATCNNNFLSVPDIVDSRLTIRTSVSDFEHRPLSVIHIEPMDFVGFSDFEDTHLNIDWNAINSPRTLIEEIHIEDLQQSQLSKTVLNKLKEEIYFLHAELHKGKPCIENPYNFCYIKEVCDQISEAMTRRTSETEIKKFKIYLELLKSLGRMPPETTELVNREKTRVDTISSLTPGSEVAFSRIGYKHHVVITKVNFYENTFDVVHLTGNAHDSFKGGSSSSSGLSKASPKEETIRFKRSHGLFRYRYTNVLSHEVASERAKMLCAIFGMLGEQYNILAFNCHHFSSFCVTGQFFSRKVGTFCRCCPRISRLQTNDDLRTKVNEMLFEHTLRKIKEMASGYYYY